MSYLKELDYSVVQQCMHCGMCLPTCPTYAETKVERNSPRGRIALMRAIADGNLEATKQFQDEMYFCLGCLACETACPAGVDYTQLFEMARAEAERVQGPLSPTRRTFRRLLLDVLFRQQWRLRLAGRLIWTYQASGLQKLARATVLRFMPKKLQELEAKTPVIRREFSPELIAPVEHPVGGIARHRVALLTGCVQDLIYSNINRDTADVLLANGCEVVTPSQQACCGSLHAHNGEYEWAKDYARRLIDQFELEKLDAIITNAAGCGSHLKHFDRLLKDDPAYAARARTWSEKVRDVSEWLLEIGVEISSRHDRGAGDLSRRLPSLPRPEDHRAAARAAECDSRPRRCTAGRIDVVLRQRRHLQPHPARDGRQAPPAQARPHRPPPARRSWPPATPAACCKSRMGSRRAARTSPSLTAVSLLAAAYRARS